jgi:two-component system, sensor histidine kinase and response regulator
MCQTTIKVNSVIAHDLRDSMTSISGISEILLENWQDFPSDEKLEIIREIKETSDSTLRLLTDLLEWGKRIADFTEPVKTSFSATGVILSVVEQSVPKLKRKNLVIRNLITQEIKVFGDHFMFASIVRNLITNAIKSCLTDGIIGIEADTSGSLCRFCITDNGIGMTKSQIDLLFTPPNEQTNILGVSKEYNNGFGLILCRDFLRINKGELWAESTEGKGTRVFFTFPMTEKTT